MENLDQCYYPSCSSSASYFCYCDENLFFCSSHKDTHRLNCGSTIVSLKSHRITRSMSMSSRSSLEESQIDNEISKIQFKLSEILRNIQNFTSNLISSMRNSLPSFKTEVEKKQRFGILDYLQTFSRNILENQVPDMPLFKTGLDFRNFQEGNKNYEGFFNEEKTGYGLVEEENKFYIGSVVKGQFNGNGIIIFSKGDYYKGSWIHGKQSGYGEYQYSDGRVFRGNFEDGKFNGYGTIVYSQGDKFQGVFIDNIKNGPGKYSYKKSDYQDYDEGIWIDGRLKGKSKIVRDGRIYNKSIT